MTTKRDEAEKARDAAELRKIADELDAECEAVMKKRWRAEAIANKWGFEILYAAENVFHENACEVGLRTTAKELRLIACAVDCAKAKDGGEA